MKTLPIAMRRFAPLSIRPALTGAARVLAYALVAIALIVMIAGARANAQENFGEGEGGGMGMMPAPAPTAGESNGPPPIARVPLRQPVGGTMMASPPYGVAPLRVGFFVVASDPEEIGFLTYEWHYGDGTASALPPEMYIFHTYKNPGTYVCTLVLKTVDGRSKTLFQGVVVRPRGD